MAGIYFGGCVGVLVGAGIIGTGLQALDPEPKIEWTNAVPVLRRGSIMESPLATARRMNVDERGERPETPRRMNVSERREQPETPQRTDVIERDVPCPATHAFCVCWGKAEEATKQRVVKVMESVPRSSRDAFIPYMELHRNGAIERLQNTSFTPDGVVTETLRDEMRNAKRIKEGAETRAYLGPLHMVYTQNNTQLTPPNAETIVWCLTMDAFEFESGAEKMWKLVFEQFRDNRITHAVLSLPKMDSNTSTYIAKFPYSLCKALQGVDGGYNMKVIFVVCPDNQLAYDRLTELVRCPHTMCIGPVPSSVP
jgi:hypothetical protein